MFSVTFEYKNVTLFSLCFLFWKLWEKLISLFLIQIFENFKVWTKLKNCRVVVHKSKNRMKLENVFSNQTVLPIPALNLFWIHIFVQWFSLFLYLNYLPGHLQSLDKNCLGPLRKAYCSSLNLLLRREVCCTSCWFYLFLNCLVFLLWHTPLSLYELRSNHYTCEKLLINVITYLIKI